MSTVAATDVWTRTKIAWARLRLFGRAAGEYFRHIVQAQRTWLFGTAFGVGLAWLNVLPGVTVPGWAVAAIIVSTLFLVQFQAFYAVREERDTCLRARATDAVIDEIAVLRTRETQLRNRVVRDSAAYAQWKAELIALRSEIHKQLERISRAEAETFHTVGNLRHGAGGGINEEHNLLLAVATRDLDHLAELIHGHTRFGD
ncbi:MAG TPA: hypothetical protein VIF14_03220 [Alphaproteobacteria bacterium]|jgi:hypothetical protein